MFVVYFVLLEIFSDKDPGGVSLRDELVFFTLLSAWTILPFFIYESLYAVSRPFFTNIWVKLSNMLVFLVMPLGTAIVFCFIVYDEFFSLTETSSTAPLGFLFISFWPLVFGFLPALANLHFVSLAKKSSPLQTM